MQNDKEVLLNKINDKEVLIYLTEKLKKHVQRTYKGIQLKWRKIPAFEKTANGHKSAWKSN